MVGASALGLVLEKKASLSGAGRRLDRKRVTGMLIKTTAHLDVSRDGGQGFGVGLEHNGGEEPLFGGHSHGTSLNRKIAHQTRGQVSQHH